MELRACYYVRCFDVDARSLKESTYSSVRHTSFDIQSTLDISKSKFIQNY